MHNGARSLNALAFSATVHCLTGCAIGEVLGMIIGTALGWSNVQTIVLAIALAFLFGYTLTSLPLLRSGMALGAVIPLALASDTVSIAVMEIVDNAVLLLVPGAMDAGLGDLKFWLSLAFALLVAGAAAYPVNRWLLARGKGHAVVHQHHAPLSPAARAGRVLLVRLLLNLIWLVFGGLIMALGYAFAALIMLILIITIPFGIAAGRMALFCLWPFGRTLVRRPDAGIASTIGNVIWILLAGWWLALGHLVTGVVMCLTIIGIPLGLANFKLIPVSLTPLGRDIVDVDQAQRLGASDTVSVPARVIRYRSSPPTRRS